MSEYPKTRKSYVLMVFYSYPSSASFFENPFDIGVYSSKEELLDNMLKHIGFDDATRIIRLPISSTNDNVENHIILLVDVKDEE